MYKFYLFVLLSSFLLPVNLRAEESCNTCKITRENGLIKKSAACSTPLDICVLDLGEDLGIIDLYSFVDLRKVTVHIGDGTFPILNAGAVVDSDTYFHLGGDNVRLYLYTAVDVAAGVLGKADILGLNDIFVGLSALICLDLNLDLSDPLNLSLGPCTLGGNVDLPVELSEWTATSVPAGVELEWATETETDADYFEIYHSTNATDYASIARTSAAGTSVVRTEYRLLHDAPGAGTNYYRLEQVDFDGTRHRFDLRSVSWEGEAGTLAAYPNPASPGQQIRIDGLSSTTQRQLQLISAAGRMLGTVRVDGTGQMLVPEGIASGLYLLRSSEHTLRLLIADN